MGTRRRRGGISEASLDPTKLLAELAKRRGGTAAKSEALTASIQTAIMEASSKMAPLFRRSLSASVVSMSEIRVRAGAMLEPAFYFILEGALKGEEEDTPAMHAEGSCVGARALLQEGGSASLTAVADSVLYKLDRPTFRALLVQESTSAGGAATARRPISVAFELLPTPVGALEHSDPDALLATHVAPTLRMDGADARPDGWCSEDAYGASLWPSSVVVARTLLEHLATMEALGHAPHTQHVVELGCGVGLPSLAALAAGAGSVLATDWSPIALELVSEAARTHQPEAAARLRTDRVNVRALGPGGAREGPLPWSRCEHSIGSIA